MRQITKRNAKSLMQTMYYALYEGKTLDTEELESTISYSEPVSFEGCLNAGNASADEQPFGTDVKYDRIITTRDIDIPIDEHSLIWVDADTTSEHDYIVAAPPLKSINAVRIAIRRVVDDE